MKRLIRLAMITAVAVSALSTLGAMWLPVNAAATQSNTPALAALMPANVDLYAELNLGKLTDSLATLNGVIGTSGTTTPISIDQLGTQFGIGLNGLDKQLSQLLGHPATLSGDVLNWLNTLAVGIPVTDAMLKNPAASQSKIPQLLLAGAVKDETAADKFITDILAGIDKMGFGFAKTTIQLNGQPATRYDNPLLNISLVRAPGYVLIGMDSVVNGLITSTGSQSTLAADAKFQKTIALLNTGSNGLSVYASSRALTYLALSSAANNAKKAPATVQIATPDAAATANATSVATLSATAAATTSATNATHIADTLKVLNGLAIGARMVDKSFVLDIAFSVDPDAVKAMANQMDGADLTQLIGSGNGDSAVSGKLTSQIPAKAVALVEGHDLTRVYTTLRSVITLLNSQPGIAGMGAAQEMQIGIMAGGFTSFEKTLKDQFNLDINTDVLSPLAGDFAVYSYLDPNDKTIKPKTGQPPFVPALLIDTTDVTKAKAFADKLAIGLPKAANVTPEKTNDGLYTLTAGSGDSAMNVAYGVSGNTFLLTTGSALSTVTNAIGGTDVLDSSAIWKSAKALLPSTYNAVLYLDVNAFAPYMTNISTGEQTANKMGQDLLRQVNSALIYSTTPAANSAVITLALTLK